jgi:hypothetical protein
MLDLEAQDSTAATSSENNFKCFRKLKLKVFTDMEIQASATLFSTAHAPFHKAIM